MVSYPSDLPGVSATYTLGVRHATIRTEMDDGYIRQRRRFTQSQQRVAVEWLFSDDEFKAFDIFVACDLNGGNDWFEIDLASGNGIATHVARIVGGEFSARFQHHFYWLVSAELDVREIPARACPGPCYSGPEHWEAPGYGQGDALEWSAENEWYAASYTGWGQFNLIALDWATDFRPDQLSVEVYVPESGYLPNAQSVKVSVFDEEDNEYWANLGESATPGEWLEVAVDLTGLSFDIVRLQLEVSDDYATDPYLLRCPRFA